MTQNNLFSPEKNVNFEDDEIQNASFSEKLALEKVKQEKRRNDLHEKETISSERRNKISFITPWIVFGGTIIASIIGSSVLVYQEFRKEDNFLELQNSMHHTQEQLQTLEKKIEIVEKRILRNHGYCAEISANLKSAKVSCANNNTDIEE